MSQTKKQHLLFIGRGASIAALMFVLFGSIYASAQTSPASYIKFNVYAMKDGKSYASGVRIQQTTINGEHYIKDYCVTDGEGKCSFVMEENDGDTYFGGSITDKTTGKPGENYGSLRDPNHGCPKVTYRYDSKAGKVYEYFDGVKSNSVGYAIANSESFYTLQCVPNSKGGYDAVPKMTAFSFGPTPTTKSAYPTTKYAYPTTKSAYPTTKYAYHTTKSAYPTTKYAYPTEEDFDVFEQEQGDVDFGIEDVKKAVWRRNNLLLSVVISSDSEEKEEISFVGECEKDLTIIGLVDGILKVKPGTKAYKRTIGATEEGIRVMNALRSSNGSFMCDLEILGYFPVEGEAGEAWDDFDDSNNFMRITLQWKKGRLKIISKETEWD